MVDIVVYEVLREHDEHRTLLRELPLCRNHLKQAKQNAKKVKDCCFTFTDIGASETPCIYCDDDD